MILTCAHTFRTWNNGLPSSYGVAHRLYTKLQCTRVASVNPGHTHVILDPAPTAAVVGELTNTHAENMRIFREFKNIDMAIKKVITKIVNEVYCCTLKSQYTGYVNRS